MPETLKRGSSGGSVREAQKLLNGAGFSVGLVDGSFGSKMEGAVKNFQAAKHASEVNGIIGNQTWTMLKSANGISG